MNILRRRTFDVIGAGNCPALKDRRGWTQVPKRPIYDLQEDLDGFGYPTKPDGIFGEITERGVQWFQEWKGLEKDGIFGPETSAVMAGPPSVLLEEVIYNALTLRNLIVTRDRLEIVGIRQKYFSDHTRNAYDDRFIILGPGVYETFQGSTDPGIKGAAVLRSGQQVYYEPGLHQGKYPCLRPVRGEKFKLIDKDGRPNIRTGWFNFHAGGNPSRLVRNWSAGCQIIAGNGGWKSRDYRRFLDLTYHNADQDRFRYSLIDYADLAHD